MIKRGSQTKAENRINSQNIETSAALKIKNVDLIKLPLIMFSELQSNLETH